MPNAPKNAQNESLMLRFRVKDTPSGLTRGTWKKVASKLGLSETEALHHAMVLFASLHGVKMKTATKVRPISLAGMDLGPLSKVMVEHDPDWKDPGA